MSIEGKKIF